MADNIEIFEFSCFLSSVKLEDVKVKQLKVQIQLGETEPLDVTLLDLQEGRHNFDINKGVNAIARMDSFDAFQDYPLYIFFQRLDSSVVCACGLDLSSLIVHSYRRKGQQETYKVNLALQKRSGEIVGSVYLDVLLRYFCDDYDEIICFEDYVEVTESPQPEPQIVENVVPEKKKRKNKLPRVNPRLADIYVLNKKYQETRDTLLKELEELNQRVVAIDSQRNKKITKKTSSVSSLTNIIDEDETYEKSSVTRHSKSVSRLSEVQQLSSPKQKSMSSTSGRTSKSSKRSIRSEVQSEESISEIAPTEKELPITARDNSILSASSLIKSGSTSTAQSSMSYDLKESSVLSAENTPVSTAREDSTLFNGTGTQSLDMDDFVSTIPSVLKKSVREANSESIWFSDEEIRAAMKSPSKQRSRISTARSESPNQSPLQRSVVSESGILSFE